MPFLEPLTFSGEKREAGTARAKYHSCKFPLVMMRRVCTNTIAKSKTKFVTLLIKLLDK